MSSSDRPGRGRPFLLIFLLLVLAVWAFRSGRMDVPPTWNPWTPLDVAAAPNLLTRYKFRQASLDGTACRLALATSELRFVALDDRETGPACGFRDAVRVDRPGSAAAQPFSLSCRAALSLAMWDQHVLQQAAQRNLGAQVRTIEHLGSYACRNINRQDGRRRSQHATADAWDIAGFVLTDGRRVRVLRDWSAQDSVVAPESLTQQGTLTAEALFLREVRDGACRWFDAVLGPDYNAAHADHFHFDRGPARICR